jgi:2-polyprenyl-6-methoxyphenol hydroxylase-like FAD-dependent oxidoreductase
VLIVGAGVAGLALAVAWLRTGNTQYHQQYGTLLDQL